MAFDPSASSAVPGPAQPWPAVYRALQNGTVGWATVRGVEEIHGEACLVVELPGGIKGIVPAAQAGLWPGQSMLELVGESVPYQVTALDRAAFVAILSRREALEQMARETWRTVAGGREIEARVIKVGQRLAVLEAGGVTALLPYSELSHGFVADPHTLLAPGRAVRVRVLRCEQAARRLIVSLKALAPDPWLNVPARYAVGGHYLGTVHRVRERGLFIELEPGVMISTRHHRHQQPVPGDRVLVRLVACDVANKQLWGALTVAGRDKGVGS
ncbi:MAG TPA: S1 RNA-binding domain-containing protein [Spirochaetia bacterium]|nr:S1 RNA-binding domain-containing protein [Spirochaetia bacterium]